MLKDAQAFLGCWWMSIFPGLAIFITVLALNTIGTGLDEALNPRLQEVGN
jgi:peptide/nickel transport system permease protein